MAMQENSPSQTKPNPKLSLNELLTHGRAWVKAPAEADQGHLGLLVPSQLELCNS